MTPRFLTQLRRALLVPRASTRAWHRRRPQSFGWPALLLFLVSFGGARLLAAQGQQADTAFDVRVARPTFRDRRPLVLFDQGHNNRHWTTTTYAPFAQLLAHDGYDIRPDTAARFRPAALAATNVLVVVNAMGPREKRDSTPFAGDEIELVRQWVERGGSLLLVTDHYPFGDAIAPFAAAFGVAVGRGVVEDTVAFDARTSDGTRLVFDRANRLLGHHRILDGWGDDERIERVITFTGTSLKGPPSSTALLLFSTAALDLQPHVKVTQEGDTRRTHVSYGNGVPAHGRAQGIALTYGQGRVVVLGEAAMLTAQLDGEGAAFGMNVPGTDNKQFVRNLMRWLARHE